MNDIHTKNYQEEDNDSHPANVGRGGGEERGGIGSRNCNYGKEKMEELDNFQRFTDFISPKYLHVVGMAPVGGGMNVMVKAPTPFWGRDRGYGGWLGEGRISKARWQYYFIQSTWAFKCKRYPYGLIKKFKARFCVRGDQQLELKHIT